MNYSDTPTVSANLDPILVAHYFIAKDASSGHHDVGAMKLQKLVYLAQGHYLAATSSRLIDDDFEAYKHGPVAASLVPRFREKLPFCKRPEFSHLQPPELPEDIRAFLDQVWDAFGNMTATQLRNLTHQHAPWSKYYDHNAHRPTIPDEAITTYFRYDISPEDRIYHPNLLIIDDGDDDMDDDEWVQKALTALGR